MLVIKKLTRAVAAPGLFLKGSIRNINYKKYKTKENLNISISQKKKKKKKQTNKTKQKLKYIKFDNYFL